jgi:hypothetical protein
MPIVPIKDINEIKRIKEAVKERFEAERSGDQDLFREQTKIFQPLVATQQESAKAIQEKIIAGQETTSKALVPLVKELQRRNDQVDLLTEQPFYPQQLPALTPLVPTSPEFLRVNLDAGLNETDKENLQDMSFELPSVVFSNKLIEETLEKIKTENRSIGQKLGKGSVGQKITSKDKEIYDSRRNTLQIYKQKIEGLEGAKQFVSTPKKTGKGLKTKLKNKIVDVIYYPSATDLCAKLEHLVADKQAGNNGVDNDINSILDELLRVKAIEKDEYDALYNCIFA